MSRGRRDRNAIHALGDLVTKVYPSKDPDDVRSIRAFLWWEKAVPPRVLANARPVRLSRGVLTVHAATTVWAHELLMLKPQLLESLRKRAPGCGVKDLRIKVGKLPPLEVRAREKTEDVRPVLASQLPEELARALAALGDEGVREAVARAASTSLGRRSSRGGSKPPSG